MNRPARIRELINIANELETQALAVREAISQVSRGCRRKLAPGQWYQVCGAREMESLPAFCTECGGDLKLADDHS